MQEQLSTLSTTELITELQTLEHTYAELFEGHCETHILTSMWKKIKAYKQELQKRGVITG